jgi:hypothetical protein
MTITNEQDKIPLFIQWIEFLPWIFQTTSKFPKSLRASLTTRIENLSLEVVERILQATYKTQKKEVLKEINLLLENIRILFRLAHTLKCLNTNSYEYAMTQLLIAGKQVGGWHKQQTPL